MSHSDDYDDAPDDAVYCTTCGGSHMYLVVSDVDGSYLQCTECESVITNARVIVVDYDGD